MQDMVPRNKITCISRPWSNATPRLLQVLTSDSGFKFRFELHVYSNYACRFKLHRAHVCASGAVDRLTLKSLYRSYVRRPKRSIGYILKNIFNGLRAQLSFGRLRAGRRPAPPRSDPGHGRELIERTSTLHRHAITAKANRPPVEASGIYAAFELRHTFSIAVSVLRV
ncbi:hypothetical protein EVAR_37689_1 [Eumeta japonica]|uniref:Uncharacterized protein n=1 Tax=Eumeta variegata TaxID=151549 RepID=A0A4C1XSQ4_EUMVA|nr:hypothetical protein EVAR_37689_1 [Eumeta japonica]